MAAISRGQPVAIVYYRYDPDEKGTHSGHTHVHNGDFFVHNGVANEDLTPGTPKQPVQVRHVATWPSTDHLTICDENADRIKEWLNKQHPDYHKSKSSVSPPDAAERLWVCIDIKDYSNAPAAERHPVAYMIDNDTNNASICSQELKNGVFTIHYWHAVNPQGTDGRTSKDPAHFNVQTGSHSKRVATYGVMSQ